MNVGICLFDTIFHVPTSRWMANGSRKIQSLSNLEPPSNAIALDPFQISVH